MDNIQMPPYSYPAFRYLRLSSFLAPRDPPLYPHGNPPPPGQPVLGPEILDGPLTAADEPDPAAAHSLWSAQYSGSNKFMVVGIDLGLVALLAVFLYVVWRQWRKGKRARVVDVESVKEGEKSEGVVMASDAERAGEGWEKEQVVVTTCVAVPEGVHRKAEDRK